MYVKQALVACAGSGTRLRKGGMDFPLSKVFIELEGRSMLYWCLLGLYQAGVDRLVMNVSDSTVRMVYKTLSQLPFEFKRVDFRKDLDLGTTGLPYHTRHLLDDYYFFECGHSVSEPDHYRRLDAELQDGKPPVVLSTFAPSSSDARVKIRMNGRKIIPIREFTGNDEEFCIGLPGVFGQEHAARLPELGFEFKKLVEFYAASGTLRTVNSNMPLEVDYVDEWREAVPHYMKHIERISAIPASP